MVANYWASTQCNTWLLSRAELEATREEDRLYADQVELAAITTWCINAVLAILARRLNLRQRVMATASVYFQRFYSKNSYCSTDPCVVLATCVYVAAKAEESAVRIRTLYGEALKMFTELGYTEFPTHSSAIGEMEFYLLEELEFDLIIFHPYTDLQKLCAPSTEILGAGARIDGADHGAGAASGRTGPAAPVASGPSQPEHATDLSAQADGSVPGEYAGNPSLAGARPPDSGAQLLQMAWLVANDMYRTDLPLQHPPYVLAVACVYLALALLPAGAQRIDASVAQASVPGEPRTDLVGALAGLNVSLSLVASVVQEMQSSYELWHQLQRVGLAAERSKGLGKVCLDMFARLKRMHTARREALLRHVAGDAMAGGAMG
ncbi:RNA polymerase II holoenzyme cyclin-like subunit [Malassezia sp. CBS 17886]|nr:RNA polymerase II holoenzyme cyclin-like subunit [Malassezia sp. CBS 17886]